MTAPNKIWAYSPERGEHAVYPTVSRSVEYTRTAVIPDPMSDPRVVALVEASIRLGKWAVANLPRDAASDELTALDDAITAMEGQTE